MICIYQYFYYLCNKNKKEVGYDIAGIGEITLQLLVG